MFSKKTSNCHLIKDDLKLSLLFFVIIFCFLPLESWALSWPASSPNTAMGQVICDVVKWFWGNMGKGIACIAVSILGIGAMLGKTSWGLAMTVGVGIALIFGAPRILNDIIGSPSGGYCP